MALYDKRCFVTSFRHNTIAVVAFVQRNVNMDRWEIDLCNSVTKDTIKLDNQSTITGKTREEAITKLRLRYAHTQKKP